MNTKYFTARTLSILRYVERNRLSNSGSHCIKSLSVSSISCWKKPACASLTQRSGRNSLLKSGGKYHLQVCYKRTGPIRKMEQKDEKDIKDDQNKPASDSSTSNNDATQAPGPVKESAMKQWKRKQRTEVTLKHVRYREKVKGQLPPPSRVEVQVIGTGAQGTPKAVMLYTDHGRYLFNCGEGTQRICMEHKKKLSRVENIFITHKSWGNIGGLLGMCLSIESFSVPQVIIHGPPGVEDLVKFSRRFSELYSLKIQKREVDAGVYTDHMISVRSIPLLPHEDNQEDGDAAEPEMKKRRLSSEQSLCVAYIIKAHQKQRALMLERCVELGMPRGAGPLLGKLKNGEDVTLEDGRVIRADDVLSQPEPSQPILILECPSSDYLPALNQNEEIQRLMLEDLEEQASVVVHLTPGNVVQTPEYQQWISRFQSTTDHLVVNETCSSVAFEGLFMMQAMLNQLDRRIFPLLPEQAGTVAQGQPEDNGDRGMPGESNLCYIARPNLKFNRDSCIHLDNAACLAELKEDPSFMEEFKAFTDKLNTNSCENSDDVRGYPELVMLGTGSAIPSKRRNVSGMLLRISDTKSILMDCGEGTLGQLYRNFGDETGEILRGVDGIFISHLHADHHMGLHGFMKARYDALKDAGKAAPDPVWLLSPANMNAWLQIHNDNLYPIMHYFRHVPLEHFYPTNRPEHTEEYKQACDALGLDEIQPVRVIHRQNPHGIVLTLKGGWKMVYSGDTVPCDNLIAAGKDCDLLLHEATLEDGFEEEAKIKRHSTTSQAIDVGMKMNAGFILLTHFSQRYAKVPIFNNSFTNKVGIAFDNMRIRPQDLPKLPTFTPVLKAMFAEDYADLEVKSKKKQNNKQNNKQNSKQR